MCSQTSHLMSTTVLSLLFLEHYSTSLCRWIQWIFLCMDYVSECMFVQAGSSFSPRFSSSQMCCCLHVWQSGINAKNMFIFYHKWTQKKSERQFHIWVQWQKESPTIQTLSSAAWAFLSSCHRGSTTASLGPEREVLGSLQQRKHCFMVCSFPSVCWEQLHHGMETEEREGSFH